MLKHLRVNTKTTEAVNNMEDAKTMEDLDTTVTNKIIVVEEDAVHNTAGIGAEAVVGMSTVILHITVGHTECVPIRSKTSGTWQTDTRRTRCGATRCLEVRKTAPARSG